MRTREQLCERGRSLRGSSRWVVYGLLAACVFHAYYWSCLVDDAYISFRYAENLAAGHGLVFNPGERVEGWTSFLWVVILGLLSLVGLPLPRAAAALGSACGVATILLAWIVGRAATPKPGPRLRWSRPGCWRPSRCSRSGPPAAGSRRFSPSPSPRSRGPT